MSEGRIALRLICYKRILESKNDQLRSEIDVSYISFIIISIKNSVFFLNKRANTNNNMVLTVVLTSPMYYPAVGYNGDHQRYIDFSSGTHSGQNTIA